MKLQNKIRIVSFFVSMAALLHFSTASLAAEMNVTIKGAGKIDVVDSIVSLVPEFKLEASAQQSTSNPVMTQKNMRFVPHVLPVRKGAEVNFPNNDKFKHQVYSFSDAKQFAIALYGGTAVKTVKFETPGVVPVGCSIHDKMLAYIYVVDTPYFSTVEKTGRLTFKDLKPGSYKVVYWHPRLKGKKKELTQSVEVSDDKVQEVKFKVSVRGKRKLNKTSRKRKSGKRYRKTSSRKKDTYSFR
jgi:plastocyanin